MVMIIKVQNVDDCRICDDFLTLLIQDERKYDATIDASFVVKDYFVNMINDMNILLLYKEDNVSGGYIFARRVSNGYLIDGLYVDIDFRNRGIATKLIKEVIKLIRLEGDYEIFIKVMKKNKDACLLYKKLGFIIDFQDNLRYLMSYSNCELVNASSYDIERIKEYKLKIILEYADNLEKNEIEDIYRYINDSILYQIDEYKNIIFDDKIVGSVLVKKIKDGYLLDEIFIEDAYRNKNIGTNVIKRIINDSDKNIYLWVYKANIRAIKLYKLLGFKIKEETDTRYYMQYLK